MSLDVLLEILRALEGLAAEVALVWLQWHVNTDVRGNVVTLDGCGAAVTPLARQVQVVGALAANVTLTDVILFMVSTLLQCEGSRRFRWRLSQVWAYIWRRVGAHVAAQEGDVGIEVKTGQWYLRRAARRMAGGRRSSATGRRAGRQSRHRRPRQAWEHSAGWECPGAVVAASRPPLGRRFGRRSFLAASRDVTVVERASVVLRRRTGRPERIFASQADAEAEVRGARSGSLGGSE